MSTYAVLPLFASRLFARLTALTLLPASLLALSLLALPPAARAAGITVIASFTGTEAGTNGASPAAGVTIDAAGNLYGTASQGGPGQGGTIWKIAAGTTTLTDLAEFGNFGDDPSGPIGGVTLDASGNLYGTTTSGGASVYGEVFELPHGSATPLTLGSFTNFPDGNYPNAGVTFDAAGNMYGTTEYGGSAGSGTVWEIPKGGTLTILASFLGQPNGAVPTAGVTLDSQGDLFGTTSQGGTVGDGTVWEIVHGSTTITTLATFTVTIGYNPSAEVTVDGAGNLFGTARGGGLNEAGTVWEIAHGTHTLTALASFGGTGTSGDGRGLDAVGGVTIDGAGNLFGTTEEGGTADAGTVWEIAHGTSTITILASFLGTDQAGDPNGAFPLDSVTEDSAGDLVGTTSGGGPAGAGTVWKMVGVAVPVGTTHPVPTALTVTPNPAHADATVTVMLTLSQTVAVSTPVTITFDGKTLGTVPVAAGSGSVSFTLGTVGVLAGAHTLGATLNGVSVSHALTLTTDTAKPVPTAFVFAPNPVAPNVATTATVTLSGPAPTGGVSAEVFGNGTDLGSITFAAGMKTATFGQTPATAGTYHYAAIENGVQVQATLTVSIPPAAPTMLTATAAPGQVTLNWKAPGGVTGATYSLYRSTSSGAEVFYKSAGTATTFVNGTVTAGTTYYYTVKTVVGGQPSVASNEAHATVPLAVPGAPKNLTAVASGGRITLQWTASTGTVASYSVYRSTSSGTEVFYKTAGTATTFVNGLVTVGTKYYYTIKAVNSGGTGAASNEASATP